MNEKRIPTMRGGYLRASGSAIIDDEDGRRELVATVNAWECRVVDPAGGVWLPDEEAEAEIRAALDPEYRALCMCISDTMRGAWHQ